MQFFYRLLDSFLVQTDIKLSIAKQGDEGERAVYLEMIKIFDAQRYRIYKNFKIPGRNFDIDFLIIGPKGVLVFEVKNSACSYIFSDQKMVKIIGNQLFSTESDSDR